MIVENLANRLLVTCIVNCCTVDGEKMTLNFGNGDSFLVYFVGGF